MNALTYGVTKQGHIYILSPNTDTEFFGQMTETLQSVIPINEVVKLEDILLTTNNLEEAQQKRNETLIHEYQCPGCVHGCDVDCGKYKKFTYGVGCESHAAGTMNGALQPLFLGLPIGFNRIGNYVNKSEYRLYIYERTSFDWEQNFLQVPVWKHLDVNGNTLVRALMPRINKPVVMVIEGDVRDRLNCIEITQTEIDQMDY